MRSPVAPVVAILVFLACAAYMSPFMPDDAFISFRYAEHLADGHGLTFNIDTAPVEAYSNLLWILVCAVLYKLGMGLPGVTPYLGLLLGITSIIVLWTLVRRRAPRWTQQLPPLLVFSACGPFVMYAISGMETALFALCLLLMVRFVDDYLEAPRARILFALALTGFATALTRPEGVLALPACLVMLAWEMRRDAHARSVVRSLAFAAAGFAVATIAYHAWRVSYFDAWLPTPFLSKGGEGTGLVSGWQTNFTSYFVNWAYYSPPQGYLYVALFALGFLGMRSIATPEAARPRGDRTAWALALLFGAVYANFVDWMPGMRYHVAIVGVLLVPATRLGALLPDAVWIDAGRRRLWRFAILCVGLFLACAINLSHLKTVSVKMNEGTELCLTPFAEWLQEAVPENSLLAMSDVGRVPYVSGLNTLDIHPQSLTDGYIARNSFSADYILGKQPDIIALSVRSVHSARMGVLNFQLYGREEFQEQYGFIGTVRHWWFDDRAYWVFINKGTPVRRDVVRQLPRGIGKQHRSGFDE